MNDFDDDQRSGTERQDKAAAEQDAEGSKQKDNPDVDETAGTGGEADDKGGLGDRTGAAGGGTPTEPHGGHDAEELRR
jgi:hypothetical protein